MTRFEARRLSFVIAIMLFICFAGAALFAAPIKNHPVTFKQPDGTVLNLFVSGDEHFNWIHDANGYTIIQDPNTGYYTYMVLQDGVPVASQYIVGRVSPESVGLQKNALPSPEKIRSLSAAFPKPSELGINDVGPKGAPSSGAINNLAVFIRFSDDAEFTTQVSAYDQEFNSSTAGVNSMYNYYREVSYNAISITTTFYPTPSGGLVVSYQDSHPRGYYQPYSAINTIGYSGGDNGTDRTLREHALLANAVNAVASSVPPSLLIDADNDGYVDNIAFIVKGNAGGWASLLWPHMWSLYSQTAMLNGKRVWNYNLELESMVSANVLCHEMFHTLGGPDLYHYSQDGMDPAGGWDVMDTTPNPPQHMSAYMKYKYVHWINSLPAITTSGTYTLSPEGSSSTGNIYRIDSPNSTTEFFVVEFRKRAGIFESSLRGEGILVYRINGSLEGNADGPPDEVYVYRPGGTTTLNGTAASANFSANVGRTAINDTTNPSSFLMDGTAGGLNISNISSTGSTMSFYVTLPPLQITRLTLGSTSVQAGASTSATVLLSAAAPAGGSTVTLSSSNSHVHVPTSVLVPAGSRTVIFTVTTDVVSSPPNSATITATFNGTAQTGITLVYSTTLVVTKAGAGTGTVTSSPAGINCGSTCSASFSSTTSVTLTATADSNSNFVGWNGGGCSGTGTCTMDMSQGRSVTATFNLVNTQFATTAVPAGSHPVAVALNQATNKIYVVNRDSSNLTLIDGATNATTNISVGATPLALAVNPTTNKIYVANSASNNVTVIDGATNSTATIPSGSNPIAVAVNPVTNKIYVANSSYPGVVTVIDGITNATESVPTGPGCIALAVNPVTNKIYVANGGGVTVIDGATNATATVAAGTSPWSVAVNSVTNKIYVANNGGIDLTVIDGATNTTTTISVGNHPSALAVNPDTNKTYVATDQGVTVIDGVTNTATYIATGSPLAVAVNTSTNKIYFANGYANSVSVLDGATNATSTVPVGSYPSAIAVNPLTNRIYVADSESNNVTVLLAPLSLAITLRDFDANAKGDLTWHNNGTGETQVWRMNGTTVNGSMLNMAIPDPTWRPLLSADFNGDSKADILWHNYSSGANYLWQTNSSLWFDGYGLEPVNDSNWQIIAAADFDGDGKADLVWRNSQTGDNYVWLMNGSAMKAPAWMQGVAGNDWQFVTIADFNGDGHPDMLWHNVTTGVYYAWLMNGTTIVSGAVPGTNTDPNWQMAAIADFNGDGRAEILWRNITNGANYMWMLDGNGNFASGAGVEPVTDMNWQIVSAGDLDGDHKADLVWRNLSTGANYVWFMNGATLVNSGGIPAMTDQNWKLY
jgi:M6 family metalloprotease-like protein